MAAELSEVATGKQKQMPSDNGARNLLSDLDDFHLVFNDGDQGVQKQADEESGMDFILDTMLTLNLDATSGDSSLYETYDTRLAAKYNPRNVTVLLRVCFNDKYAAPTYSIPGHRVLPMWRNIHFIEERFPVTFSKVSNDSLQYSPIPIVSKPIFLLQETSYRKIKLRTSQWIGTLFPRDGPAFMQWQQRNIQVGKEAVVKMEIRVRADGITENFRFIQDAGEARSSLEDHKYAQLNPSLSSNTICDMLYRKGPALSETLTEDTTLDFFPERLRKYGYKRARYFDRAGPANQRDPGTGATDNTMGGLKAAAMELCLR
ncbi:hypothetical protein LTR84_005139 [Exophiala bonariae]|uniref:Uncharacterized protein n=1 Tax=Exophiala bonariae TaxID=1690606 RepID=A0AAV9NNX1_9EURO|nr:hypothetical protein LTR84_005139 [Exophiala bonariae]